VVNVANGLTLLRLLLVPAFVALLLANGGHSNGWRVWACLAFVVATVTDLLTQMLAAIRGANALTLVTGILVLAGALSAHTDALFAALQITSADYLLLSDVSAGVIANDNLTLANLSALYRHVTLARGLGLSIRDYLTLKAILGVDPFQSAAATLAFCQSVQQHADLFSIPQLDYLLRHQVAPNSTVAPPANDIALFLTRLRTDLAKIVSKRTDGMTAQEIADADAAADAARRNLVKHAFSGALGISPAASSDLLGTVVRSLANAADASIEEFVDPVFIVGTLAIVESGAVVDQSVAWPGLFQLYRRLHKVALVLSAFAISDDELDFFLQPPAGLGHFAVGQFIFAHQFIYHLAFGRERFNGSGHLFPEFIPQQNVFGRINIEVQRHFDIFNIPMGILIVFSEICNGSIFDSSIQVKL